MPWTGEGEGGSSVGRAEQAALAKIKKAEQKKKGALPPSAEEEGGGRRKLTGRVGRAEEPEELSKLLRELEDGSENLEGGKRRRGVNQQDNGENAACEADRNYGEWLDGSAMDEIKLDDHSINIEEGWKEYAMWDMEGQPLPTTMGTEGYRASMGNISTLPPEERRLPEVPLDPPWKATDVEAARSLLSSAREALEQRRSFSIEIYEELFQADGPVERLAKEWQKQFDRFGWNLARGISQLGARYMAPHLDSWRVRALLEGTTSGELVAIEAEEGVRVPIKEELLIDQFEAAQDLEARLTYGAHKSARMYGAHVGQKIINDLVRGWAGIVPKEAWKEIKGLAISPLGAVARKDKVRVVHDLTFELNGDLSVNGMVDKERLPACDIGRVFDDFVERAYTLRMMFPEEHLVMRTSDIAEAFRIKHIAFEDVSKFSYTWKDFIILDLRLQFGYCGAPGHFQRHSSSMIEAHNKTRWDDPRIDAFLEDPVITNFLTIEQGWQPSKVIQRVPVDAEFLTYYRASHRIGGECIENAGIYIDDAWELEINSGDKLRRSAANMLRVHYEALGYPGEDGQGPISLKKYGGWTSEGDLLGLRVNLNKMLVSLPQEKVVKARELLAEFPSSRRKASYKEVMSLIGRLRHYAFCIRPGRYFLRRLINVTLGGTRSHNPRREILLDAEFHRDIDWWTRLMDLHAQSPDRYSLPIFAHVRRTADIQVIGDASGRAGGGVITGLGLWWRIEWSEEIRRRLINTNKGRAAGNAGCVSSTRLLTIAHLELAVLVIGVATMIANLGTVEPISVLALCDNSNAVSWHRKAGARCPIASDMIRVLGELETRHRVYLSARHLAGVNNVEADAISRLSLEEAASYMEGKQGAHGNPQLAKKERFMNDASKRTFMYVQAPEEITRRILCGSL